MPARADRADGLEQDPGEGREIQPQLVGPHGRRRGPVGEQVELLLLYSVLHVAAGAVQILVERPGADLPHGQAGDHEARVRAAQSRQHLRLAHHASAPAPARQRPVPEVPEPARRPARRHAAAPRTPHLARDLPDKPRVAGNAEHVVHRVRLAPGHDRLAAEAGIPPHQDPHLRPRLADLRDDPDQLVKRALRRVDVRRPQAAAQHMFAAGDIKRQVAVTVVIRVEVAPFLGAVQRVVGRVEIEDDLLGRRAVRLQEQRDQQTVDRRRVGGDPLVAVARRPVRDAELEPVERARTGQRMAAVALAHPVGAGDVAAADGQRQHAVVAQLVVIVEILVPQSDRHDPLRDETVQLVLAALGVAMIREASREPAGHAEHVVGLPQEQRAAVR